MTNDLTPAAAVTDGFDADANDPTASPIRGSNMRFKDGEYYDFGERIEVGGKSYAVIDHRAGWQKLEAGCPPEYLMRQPGGPRPPRPHVAEEDWPTNLNDKPEHPYKWTDYLYLLDTESGELSTFWTNTAGGGYAVRELVGQVGFMRTKRPHAIPIVSLESRIMPGKYAKQAPHFRILGYRDGAIWPDRARSSRSRTRPW
jgi:hypothetical protein